MAERQIVERFLLGSTLYDAITPDAFARHLPPIYRESRDTARLHADYLRQRQAIRDRVHRNLDLEYAILNTDKNELIPWDADMNSGNAMGMSMPFVLEQDPLIMAQVSLICIHKKHWDYVVECV